MVAVTVPVKLVCAMAAAAAVVLRRDRSVAEQRERHDRDVDVAMSSGHVGHERVVRRGVVAVEGDHVDRQRRVTQAGRRLLALLHVAAGEHHRAGRRAEQFADDGQADVAGATEQQDGLWFAECVVHECSFSR